MEVKGKRDHSHSHIGGLCKSMVVYIVRNLQSQHNNQQKIWK